MAKILEQKVKITNENERKSGYMPISRTNRVVVSLIQKSQKFEFFTLINFTTDRYLCNTLNKISKVVFFYFLADKEENWMDRR